MEERAAPVTVFLAYAQKDEELRDRLDEHLGSLKQLGRIHELYDRRVEAGEEWSLAVEERFNQAQVIILLISSDFLTSETSDLERAMARHKSGDARVIPVLVRPVAEWQQHPFGKLEVLPKSKRPVTMWTNPDAAWVDVVEGIGAAIQSVAKVPQRPPPRPEYPNPETRAISEKLQHARARKEVLRSRGHDTAEVDDEILKLRRWLRESGQLKAGDILDERYALLKEVGRGGFASVWRALDEERGDEVAVKVLHGNLAGDSLRRDRFFRGARIMSELQHEAVVRVLRPSGDDGGWLYFVMEYVPGGNLQKAVLEERVLRNEIIPILLRVGGALAEAHAKGLVHRDVKPANILLDANGAPKLTDFDLVAAADTTGGTRTGAMGSFIYAAPELMTHPQEANARADVYGLAMTAVFGLSGGKLSMDILRDPARIIHGLPCGKRMKAALTRAIEWDPRARQADARELCSALEQARSDDERPAPKIPPGTRLKLKPGHNFNDQYLVLRLIEEGFVSDIYEVLDTTTNQRCILKMIHASILDSSQAQEGFYRTMDIRGRSVRSNYVVRFLHAGIDRETRTSFLVMEPLSDGHSLSKALRGRSTFEREESLSYLHQVASGLDDIHAAGFVHGDIRPSNIYLASRGPSAAAEVKILNLGIYEVLSRFGAKGKHRLLLSESRNYKAPEQFLPGGTLSAATDIYALGQTAFMLLVGEPYWREYLTGDTTLSMFEELLARGQRERPTLFTRRKMLDLSASFEDWFSRATAPRPEDRFGQATTAISELAGVLGLKFPSRKIFFA